MAENDRGGKRAGDWWRGGVIYQIYPRSFFDSNGDGIGDLPGITAKLGYVAQLGVDAIWLAPFFKSPMKDFGYDVSDYREVDPIFGTLQDFDALVKRAHELGLKVLIDQVYSHTSDRHPWFKESRADRANPKSDWYVWADPKPDGTPPNNWLSVFGGSAWQWETRRRQYYLHNFLASQPDLNFHAAAVQDQILAVGKFWLDRGVDGFRLDTANFYFHDAQLRDNPAWGDRARTDYSVALVNPYAFQQHKYDKTRPENLAFMERLRVLLDRYSATTSVGEIAADDSLGTMAEYTAGGRRLHMAYVFDFLNTTFSAQHIRGTVEALEARVADGWPCWSFGNHDVARVLTRWGGAEAPPALSTVLVAVLGSLRGTLCLYQGEELALTEADVPFDELQDPLGIEFWPDIKGRDGCRTPMPWVAGAPHAGFSERTAWLPIPAEHQRRAVDQQEPLANSVLNAFRRFLAWRRSVPALRLGSIRFVDAPPSALALVRDYAGQSIFAAFNLTATPATVVVPAGHAVVPLSGHGFESACLAGGQVELPAYAAFFGELK